MSRCRRGCERLGLVGITPGTSGSAGGSTHADSITPCPDDRAAKSGSTTLERGHSATTAARVSRHSPRGSRAGMNIPPASIVAAERSSADSVASPAPLARSNRHPKATPREGLERARRWRNCGLMGAESFNPSTVWQAWNRFGRPSVPRPAQCPPFFPAGLSSSPCPRASSRPPSLPARSSASMNTSTCVPTNSLFPWPGGPSRSGEQS